MPYGPIDDRGRVSGVWRRQAALPGEHGAWAFLLSPLLIGLFAGGRWTVVSLYLVVAVLCGFLIRHPITLLIKAYSGRRSREILPAAWFWAAAYAAIGLLQVLGLVIRGFGYILYLAIPGVPVFLWSLYLVSRRAERHQWPVEVAAVGVLALGAPAAYWVGLGRPDAMAWLLWVLVWSEAVTMIVHTYLRLSQRALERPPARAERIRMGRGSLLVAFLGLAAVLALSLSGVVPRGLFLPYALLCAEAIRGVARPAMGLKPTTIGYQQLAFTTAFTALFILTWRL